MSDQRWDADLYDAQHSFVSTLGNDLLDLVGAQPGERILDLGCGTGDHVVALLSTGAEAFGIDSSPEMIARAQAKHPGLPVSLADAREIDYHSGLDAILSNATLHWVPEADRAAAAITRSLRSGGRFVAEFGGAGNVGALVAAAESARARMGVPPARSPWYYPTIGEYATVLEAAGLQVSAAWLFDRPTRLDGEHGAANWLRMFAGHLLAGLPDPDAYLSAVEAALRPTLWRDASWWADYRRIRVVAIKP
jgi:trans-aconitate methyltransferase